MATRTVKVNGWLRASTNGKCASECRYVNRGIQRVSRAAVVKKYNDYLTNEYSSYDYSLYDNK